MLSHRRIHSICAPRARGYARAGAHIWTSRERQSNAGLQKTEARGRPAAVPAAPVTPRPGAHWQQKRSRATVQGDIAHMPHAQHAPVPLRSQSAWRDRAPSPCKSHPPAERECHAPRIAHVCPAPVWDQPPSDKRTAARQARKYRCERSSAQTQTARAAHRNACQTRRYRRRRHRAKRARFPGR